MFYGDCMKIIYDNKTINVVDCNTFFSRLKGFMFQKEITHALLFNQCNSIHTFFMRRNIDVIMCDKENKILYYYSNLGKNKIIWPKKNVYKTIEFPVGFFAFKIGTTVRMDE